MIFKFTAVNSVTDQVERRRRLADLYSRFEKNTASAVASEGQADAASSPPVREHERAGSIVPPQGREGNR